MPRAHRNTNPSRHFRRHDTHLVQVTSTPVCKSEEPINSSGSRMETTVLLLNRRSVGFSLPAPLSGWFVPSRSARCFWTPSDTEEACNLWQPEPLAFQGKFPPPPCLLATSASPDSEMGEAQNESAGMSSSWTTWCLDSGDLCWIDHWFEQCRGLPYPFSDPLWRYVIFKVLITPDSEPQKITANVLLCAETVYSRYLWVFNYFSLLWLFLLSKQNKWVSVCTLSTVLFNYTLASLAAYCARVHCEQRQKPIVQHIFLHHDALTQDCCWNSSFNLSVNVNISLWDK